MAGLLPFVHRAGSWHGTLSLPIARGCDQWVGGAWPSDWRRLGHVTCARHLARPLSRADCRLAQPHRGNGRGRAPFPHHAFPPQHAAPPFGSLKTPGGIAAGGRLYAITHPRLNSALLPLFFSFSAESV